MHLWTKVVFPLPAIPMVSTTTGFLLPSSLLSSGMTTATLVRYTGK